MLKCAYSLQSNVETLMFAIIWLLSVFLIGAQKCVVSLDITFCFFFDSSFDGGGKAEHVLHWKMIFEKVMQNWGRFLPDLDRLIDESFQFAEMML